jgi:hypothetical protein
VATPRRLSADRHGIRLVMARIFSNDEKLNEELKVESEWTVRGSGALAVRARETDRVRPAVGMECGFTAQIS